MEVRPLRVGEIIEASLRLYFGNWRVLMTAAAAVAVPLELLSGIILLAGVSRGSDISGSLLSTGGGMTAAETNARLDALGVVLLVEFVVIAFVTASCVRAISALYLGRTSDARNSLVFALRRLLPLLVMEVVYVVGLFVGFLAFLLPGIWLYVSWSVAVPALLIERQNPFVALARSRHLVRGSWWPVAGATIVSIAIVYFLGAIVRALFGGATLGSDPSVLAAVIVTTLTGIVATVLLQPFVATVATVLYFELRFRREGEDTGLLTDQLDLPRDVTPEQ